MYLRYTHGHESPLPFLVILSNAKNLADPSLRSRVTAWGAGDFRSNDTPIKAFAIALYFNRASVQAMAGLTSVGAGLVQRLPRTP